MGKYGDIAKRVERVFFGDFERAFLTGAIVLILAVFAPRLAVALVVIWLLYLEYRVGKRKGAKAA